MKFGGTNMTDFVNHFHEIIGTLDSIQNDFFLF